MTDHQIWYDIIDAHQRVQALLDRVLPATAAARVLVGADALRALQLAMRNQLGQLRTKLGARLTEQEAYQTLFPLVLHCDERVLCRLSKDEQSTWPLLQRELFQVDHGGEVFFDFTDEHLRKKDTAPLLFEVLYFCLSDGFVGRCAGNPAQIAEYKDKLKARIPHHSRSPGTEDPERPRRSSSGARGSSPERRRPRPRVESVASPVWYYTGTLLLIVMTPVVLLVLSNW